ncbi:GntR family transcriptional regulator [Paenibacillus sp. NEAU-GSW1]|uniref:GntR family transcriptional regulator n=1 Tax=Paenibacillus sp. NEAU-GSW1 TaxID=2682486 RepID=UPI0012E141B2|nr:GntR family transcriptional regulator [Paenibacillus sp. NEAU-GSW1]MUT68628.1 GntR family transcriptional regulator [Paenibacillus sp. NEAU-GSW1]
MIIELDLQSDIPIYTQLMDQIIEGIANGALQPGESLPSVRSLAADIGINLHTVNKAYTLLKQEGFIQVHRKKGVVVVDKNALPSTTEDYLSRVRKQLRPIAAEAICRGLSEEQLNEMIKQLYSDIQQKDRE